METNRNSTLFLDRLLSGEEVKCNICKKGIYKPFNPECEINHYFICNNCGSRFHWDPVVDIE